MAIYHAHGQVIGRGAGRSAVAAAAYRSGSSMVETIVDKETGVTAEQTWDYSNKKGVVFSSILAPSNAPDWVYDRQNLWNKVTQNEVRKDAQLAREFNVALPKELTQEQNIELAVAIVEECFIKYGMIADLNVHLDNEDNPHMHVMLTMRDLVKFDDGSVDFGFKNRSWNSKEFLDNTRMNIAHITNQHLELHGFTNRVSHLSHQERGIDLEPSIHIGPAGMKIPLADRKQIADEISKKNAKAMITNPELFLHNLTINKPVFTEEDIALAVSKALADEVSEIELNSKVDISQELLASESEDAGIAKFMSVYNKVLQSEQLKLVVEEDLRGRKLYTTTKRFNLEERYEAVVKELGARDYQKLAITEEDIIKTSFVEDVVDKIKQIGKEFEELSGINLGIEEKKELSSQQKQVVIDLVNGNDLVVLEGLPGTGKTLVMQEIVRQYQKAGKRVLGTAPSAVAALNLGNVAGIESRNVVAWRKIWQLERGEEFTLGLPIDYYDNKSKSNELSLSTIATTRTLTNRDVLIIDEASMVELATMDYLLQEAKKAGAKIILVGDNNQFTPVGIQGALAKATELVQVSQLSEVRRQKSESHRQATQLLADYKITEALDIYTRDNRIALYPNDKEVKDALIKDYVDNYLAKAKELGKDDIASDQSVVICVYTNAAGIALNTAVREKLKLAGVIGSKVRSICFGNRILELGVGEQIVFEANRSKLGVLNGEVGTIMYMLGVKDDPLAAYLIVEVKKANGRKITTVIDSRSYKHINYGYAVTAYKLQGATVDRTLVYNEEQVGYEAFNVMMTRHREDVKLYAAQDMLENFVDKQLNSYGSAVSPDRYEFDSREEEEKWQVGLRIAVSRRANLSLAIDYQDMGLRKEDEVIRNYLKIRKDIGDVLYIINHDKKHQPIEWKVQDHKFWPLFLDYKKERDSYARVIVKDYKQYKKRLLQLNMNYEVIRRHAGIMHYTYAEKKSEDYGINSNVHYRAMIKLFADLRAEKITLDITVLNRAKELVELLKADLEEVQLELTEVIKKIEEVQREYYRLQDQINGYQNFRDQLVPEFLSRIYRTDSKEVLNRWQQLLKTHGLVESLQRVKEYPQCLGDLAGIGLGRWAAFTPKRMHAIRETEEQLVLHLHGYEEAKEALLEADKFLKVAEYQQETQELLRTKLMLEYKQPSRWGLELITIISDLKDLSEEEQLYHFAEIVQREKLEGLIYDYYSDEKNLDDPELEKLDKEVVEKANNETAGDVQVKTVGGNIKVVRSAEKDDNHHGGNHQGNHIRFVGSSSEGRESIKENGKESPSQDNSNRLEFPKSSSPVELTKEARDNEYSPERTDGHAEKDLSNKEGGISTRVITLENAKTTKIVQGDSSSTELSKTDSVVKVIKGLSTHENAALQLKGDNDMNFNSKEKKVDPDATRVEVVDTSETNRNGKTISSGERGGGYGSNSSFGGQNSNGEKLIEEKDKEHEYKEDEVSNKNPGVIVDKTQDSEAPMDGSAQTAKTEREQKVEDSHINNDNHVNNDSVIPEGLSTEETNKLPAIAEITKDAKDSENQIAIEEKEQVVTSEIKDDTKDNIKEGTIEEIKEEITPENSSEKILEEENALAQMEKEEKEEANNPYTRKTRRKEGEKRFRKSLKDKVIKPSTPKITFEEVTDKLTSSHYETIFRQYIRNLNSKDPIIRRGSQIECGSIKMTLKTGLWYRFKIGEGGNIFHFVAQATGKSPRDSLLIVAEYVGLRDEGYSKDNNFSHTPALPVEKEVIQEIQELEEWVVKAPPSKALPFVPEKHLKWMLKTHKVEGVYEYKSAAGELLGYTVRLVEKATGTKQVWPIAYCRNESLNKEEWRPKGFKDQKGFKPIYGAEKLAQDKRVVLIVEGEKTADAAQKLLPEYCVVSWLGGSQAASNVDWQQLQGREVVIWPDNDAAGMNAAKIIKTRMINMEPLQDAVFKNIAIVDAAKLGLPEKWDLADSLPRDSKLTMNDIKHAITEAQEYSRSSERLDIYIQQSKELISKKFGQELGYNPQDLTKITDRATKLVWQHWLECSNVPDEKKLLARLEYDQSLLNRLSSEDVQYYSKARFAKEQEGSNHSYLELNNESYRELLVASIHFTDVTDKDYNKLPVEEFVTTLEASYKLAKDKAAVIYAQNAVCQEYKQIFATGSDKAELQQELVQDALILNLSGSNNKVINKAFAERLNSKSKEVVQELPLKEQKLELSAKVRGSEELNTTFKKPGLWERIAKDQLGLRLKEQYSLAEYQSRLEWAMDRVPADFMEKKSITREELAARVYEYAYEKWLTSNGEVSLAINDLQALIGRAMYELDIVELKQNIIIADWRRRHDEELTAGKLLELKMVADLHNRAVGYEIEKIIPTTPERYLDLHWLELQVEKTVAKKLVNRNAKVEYELENNSFIATIKSHKLDQGISQESTAIITRSLAEQIVDYGLQHGQENITTVKLQQMQQVVEKELELRQEVPLLLTQMTLTHSEQKFVQEMQEELTKHMSHSLQKNLMKDFREQTLAEERLFPMHQAIEHVSSSLQQNHKPVQEHLNELTHELPHSLYQELIQHSFQQLKQEHQEIEHEMRMTYDFSKKF